ncbi:uncharacterized protein cimip4 isoform 2-T2 [Menidia menidia]
MTSFDQKEQKVAGKKVGTVGFLTSPLLHCADAGPPPQHHDYRSLSQCLRTNLFPGAPSAWRTNNRDSFTAHPMTNWPPDPHAWYGHRTDELVDREKHHEPEAE